MLKVCSFVTNCIFLNVIQKAFFLSNKILQLVPVHQLYGNIIRNTTRVFIPQVVLGLYNVSNQLFRKTYFYAGNLLGLSFFSLGPGRSNHENFAKTVFRMHSRQYLYTLLINFQSYGFISFIETGKQQPLLWELSYLLFALPCRFIFSSETDYMTLGESEKAGVIFWVMVGQPEIVWE